MTSINIRFRASKKGDTDLGRIVFRVIHQRKSREVASPIKFIPTSGTKEIRQLIIHLFSKNDQWS